MQETAKNWIIPCEPNHVRAILLQNVTKTPPIKINTILALSFRYVKCSRNLLLEKISEHYLLGLE